MPTAKVGKMHLKQTIMINLIAALDSNNGIGKDSKLPWPRLKDDMEWFQSLTWRTPVIMGRNTWNSLPTKVSPLKNRHNIVLSKYPDFVWEPGIEVCRSLPEALERVKHWSNVFIIGGAQLYKEALDTKIVDEMFITHIQQSFQCDTFFPIIKENEWIIKKYGGFWYEDSKCGEFFSEFLQYTRINNE